MLSPHPRIGSALDRRTIRSGQALHNWIRALLEHASVTEIHIQSLHSATSYLRTARFGILGQELRTSPAWSYDSLGLLLDARSPLGTPHAGQTCVAKSRTRMGPVLKLLPHGPAVGIHCPCTASKAYAVESSASPALPYASLDHLPHHAVYPDRRLYRPGPAERQVAYAVESSTSPVRPYASPNHLL